MPRWSSEPRRVCVHPWARALNCGVAAVRAWAWSSIPFAVRAQALRCLGRVVAIPVITAVKRADLQVPTALRRERMRYGQTRDTLLHKLLLELVGNAMPAILTTEVNNLRIAGFDPFKLFSCLKLLTKLECCAINIKS